MPTLSSKSLILPTGSFQGLSLLSENLSKAMESHIQPMIQAQEAIENLFEPIRQIQEDLKNAFLPMQQMCESLSKALKPAIEMMNITAKTFENYRPINFVEFVEGEILESEKVQSPTLLTQIATIPNQEILLPATDINPVYQKRSAMGLKQISGGNFSYKRRTLGGISLRNREGQLLGFLFENSDLFISDETMCEKFYTRDTMDESQIVKLLKNKFKLNGLKATIKRQGDGYILISIEYLQ